jgi:hypothetical protein
VIDVDGVVRAKLACDRHARGVTFAASDDDAGGAGLLGGDHAGEPSWPGPRITTVSPMPISASP